MFHQSNLVAVDQGPTLMAKAEIVAHAPMAEAKIADRSQMPEAEIADRRGPIADQVQMLEAERVEPDQEPGRDL